MSIETYSFARRPYCGQKIVIKTVDGCKEIETCWLVDRITLDCNQSTVTVRVSNEYGYHLRTWSKRDWLAMPCERDVDYQPPQRPFPIEAVVEQIIKNPPLLKLLSEAIELAMFGSPLSRPIGGTVSVGAFVGNKAMGDNVVDRVTATSEVECSLSTKVTPLHCKECGKPFQPGESMHMSYTRAGWVHSKACGDQKPLVVKRGPVEYHVTKDGRRFLEGEVLEIEPENSPVPMMAGFLLPPVPKDIEQAVKEMHVIAPQWDNIGPIIDQDHPPVKVVDDEADEMMKFFKGS